MFRESLVGESLSLYALRGGGLEVMSVMGGMIGGVNRPGNSTDVHCPFKLMHTCDFSKEISSNLWVECML